MNDDKKLNPENEPLENAEEVATATTNNASNNVGKEDSLATFTNEYKKRRAEIKNEIKTLKAEYKEAISQEISNETKERNKRFAKEIVLSSVYFGKASFNIANQIIASIGRKIKAGKEITEEEFFYSIKNRQASYYKLVREDATSITGKCEDDEITLNLADNFKLFANKLQDEIKKAAGTDTIDTLDLKFRSSNLIRRVEEFILDQKRTKAEGLTGEEKKAALSKISLLEAKYEEKDNAEFEKETEKYSVQALIAKYEDKLNDLSKYEFGSAIEEKITKLEKEAQRVLPEKGPIDKNNGKEILLSLKNVDITFGKGDRAVKAVKNASFDIYKGETFSLVGESGSGKTTIGRAVIRVNPLAGGEIDYKGVRISGRIPHNLDRDVIRNIQMVFQDPAASLNERATIDYIVSEGLYNFHLYKNEADRVQKVENMIQEVGLLPEHLTRYPHEFSGGQRQRVGLARAFVMEPELIVADEPISALDVSIRAQILNLLTKFKVEKGLTCLFIAHDLSIVRFISDRIGVIYKGDIVEIAEAEELFDFPLHPYTRSLISAIPIPDPVLEKNKVLFTYDPSIHDYSTDKPSLVDIGNNHLVFGNKAEIEEYKRIRESGEHPKSITLITPEEKAKLEEETKKDNVIKEEDIELPPLHDTGSIWYAILGFFFSIIGAVLWIVFYKIKYFRNFKISRKGTLLGLILKGVVLLIFGIGLIIANT